jgi:hypothetical protein
LWCENFAQSGTTCWRQSGDGRQMLTDHGVDEQNCALLRPLEVLPGEEFELKKYGKIRNFSIYILIKYTSFHFLVLEDF